MYGFLSHASSSHPHVCRADILGGFASVGKFLPQHGNVANRNARACSQVIELAAQIKSLFDLVKLRSDNLPGYLQRFECHENASHTPL